MKKSVLKKIMILCFALFGMVMTGNNVFAGGDENDHDCPDLGEGGGTITCSQYPGYNAQCWIYDIVHWHHTGEICKWTGNQFHFCMF